MLAARQVGNILSGISFYWPIMDADTDYAIAIEPEILPLFNARRVIATIWMWKIADVVKYWRHHHRLAIVA